MIAPAPWPDDIARAEELAAELVATLERARAEAGDRTFRRALDLTLADLNFGRCRVARLRKLCGKERAADG